MLDLPTITNPLDFCLCLDLLYSTCDEILTNNPGDVKKQVTKIVAKWHETSLELTWEKVVDALFCHQHNRAAVELAKKKGVDWRPLQTKWMKH